MGQPKKQRKKYDRPFRPYDKGRIQREKKLLSEYGLRRKHELWRAEKILRDFRRRARELQALRNEEKERMLLEKINKIGISCSGLDDVLEIKIENLLDRRLQTFVFKKGYAETPRKARQLIVHGHVYVDKRKTSWPSFIVTKDLEDKIDLSPKIKSAVMNKDG
jgi:small subunit ribosomal protein S4